MRGGCGPLCSFELNQARRYARSGTAKGRDAATAAQHARLRREVACGSCGPPCGFELN